MNADIILWRGTSRICKELHFASSDKARSEAPGLTDGTAQSQAQEDDELAQACSHPQAVAQDVTAQEEAAAALAALDLPPDFAHRRRARLVDLAFLAAFRTVRSQAHRAAVAPLRTADDARHRRCRHGRATRLSP